MPKEKFCEEITFILNIGLHSRHDPTVATHQWIRTHRWVPGTTDRLYPVRKHWSIVLKKIIPAFYEKWISLKLIYNMKWSLKTCIKYLSNRECVQEFTIWVCSQRHEFSPHSLKNGIILYVRMTPFSFY